MVLKERLGKMDVVLFAVVVGYALIVLIPIYNQAIVRGRLFGFDIPEYLLTSRCLVLGEKNLYKYPYPLMPILYVIPTLIIRDSLTLYVFALFVSGFLMVSITCAMYYLLKDFIKTNIARITAGLFFGTFPLTLDIIGWGGQSTLMAVLLGLSSIVFLKRYLRDMRIKFLILSSFLIMLSALSEPYVALYFLVTLGILILMKTRQHDLRALLKTAISLAPSFASIATLAYSLRIHNKVSCLPLIIYAAIDPSILSEMLSRLTFSYSVIYLALNTIVLTYLLTCLVSKFITKTRSFNDHTHIVASTAMASLIQILITPAQYADRGLFLVSIPLALMLGKVIDSLTYRQMRSSIKLLALATLLSASIVSGIGIHIYQNSLGFYFVDKELLSNISFIRYEEGNVVYISQHPWAFSLAYMTDKNIYPTTQPVWFIRDPQINASILAMSLAWGVRWIDAGEIKVVDATPVWAQPAPAIYIAKYPYYVELFRLSDSALPIVFSPTNNESIVWHESPFYARKIEAWNTNTSMFSVYKYETLIVNKTVNVSNDGIINIVLNYSFINSFPREIKVRLISLMLKDTKAHVLFNNDTYAQIKLLQSFREPWLRQYYDTTIEVFTLSPNVKISVEFTENDEWGLPEVMITLNSSGRVSSITVLLKVKVNNVKNSFSHVVLENNVIKDNNIRWIIIDKHVHPDIVQRFQRDPLYEKYVEFPKWVIFRVKNHSTAIGHPSKLCTELRT